MNLPKPVMHLPLALIVGASLMVSQQLLADDVGQLPATKHQAETVKGLEGSVAPQAPTKAADASEHGLLLTGEQEVPAVKTMATGRASITVDADKTVVGGISTSGIVGTAAHIHAAASGKNGPVVITLVQDGEHGWLVPADSSLTDAQYANFEAGELYVNVHSAAHGAGEIRVQLKP